MDQYSARPFVEVLNEVYPVVGVVFAEGGEPEKYVDEPPSTRLTGLRAVFGMLFGHRG